ncbi:MAG: hypothetical protein WKF40_08230 [Thermoleophilaceae bacterium]
MVLCATIWLSLLGAPLGVVGLLLGVKAVRDARRDGRRTVSGWVAIVLSALAVLSLPFLGWACNSWLICV